MLTIRLRRTGRTKRPYFRVILTEKSRGPQGKFIETLGSFNPRDKKRSLTIKEDRIKYWLSQGAQPSPVVHNLLIDTNVLTGPKKKTTRQKRGISQVEGDKVREKKEQQVALDA